MSTDIPINTIVDTYIRIRDTKDALTSKYKAEVAANVVIWYAPITSIEYYLQANARVHRQGQKNPVTVVHIEGSPVEAKLYAALQNKLDVHTKIIDLYRNELNE